MRAITETTDDRVNRNRRNRAWLQSWNKTVQPWLWGSVAAGLLTGLATVVQLGLMAWLVYAVIVQGLSALQPLLWPFVGLLLAVLARAAGLAGQGICGAAAARSVRTQIRAALLSQWAQQGPVHMAGESSAALASEWVEQVDALEGYYARFQPQLYLSVLLPLIILILVFSLDWLAALFLLAAAPLIPVFMALVGMGAERLNQQHFASASRMAGHFLDRVRGFTTLQLFGRGEASVQTVAKVSDDYRRLNIRTLRVAFLSSAVLEFFASVSIAVVAIYVGFGLLGYIDFGPAADLTLFTGLLVLLLAPEFFQPLRTLSQHYHDRAAALGAAEHLLNRLEAPQSHALSTQPSPQRTAPLPLIATLPNWDKQDLPAQHPAANTIAVAVDNLAVRYAKRGRVVSGVSFQLPEGQSLVLTGPSGSGKSSLLNVLAGFYPPDEGCVSVFGRAPGEAPVAWMSQRPFIVQGSWADNLRLIAPQATEQQMRDAVAQAGLGHLLAQLPQGLQTPVGENGQGLSGGQAHRLALARVFLAPVKLVLLDEPTSGLDPFTRADVIAAIKALVQTNITLVMATHQSELIAIADHQLALTGSATREGAL